MSSNFLKNAYDQSSHCGIVETNPTSIMRMQVWSLASLSGSRIWHCSELWCRSQMQLGSGVAMAVAELPYAVGVALKSKNKNADAIFFFWKWIFWRFHTPMVPLNTFYFDDFYRHVFLMDKLLIKGRKLSYSQYKHNRAKILSPH